MSSIRSDWVRKISGIAVLVAAALVLACATATVSAQTIVDTPVLSPAVPAAGQTVNVELHGAACVLYLEAPDYPPTIVRNGNAITLRVQAVVASDGILCIYPIQTVAYSIGSFGPGSYAVTVQAQFTNFFSQQITQTLGTLPFTVASVSPAPALSLWGFAIMTLMLTAVGVARKRRNRDTAPSRRSGNVVHTWNRP